MFFALVSGDALDIGAAQLAEMSPLREHPAPTAIHLAQDSEPGLRAHLGKSNLQVSQRDRPIRPIEIHRPSTEPRTRTHRSLQRHRTQRRRHSSNAGVFDSSLNSANLSGHRETRECSEKAAACKRSQKEKIQNPKPQAGFGLPVCPNKNRMRP